MPNTTQKVTVRVCTDIALIKYWGKKDERLRLPENGNISMKLNGLDTTTSVEFKSGLEHDVVTIDGESSQSAVARVTSHLDRVRSLAGISERAVVESANNFPKSTGLSSSSSAFAALTVAATKAAGLNLSERELSILARQGSGSACRCVCEGFVEWLDGDSSETSYAQTLHPSNYWDIRDLVVIVATKEKPISSTEGHTTARTSPFYERRLIGITSKIQSLKSSLAMRDFEQLGEVVEKEALEFHSILFTSNPPLIAWLPGTVAVMHAVVRLRAEGVPAYFTINTGFNVHVLTLPEYESKVVTALRALPEVTDIIQAKVGGKPEIITI
ncbi:diphosphomevalonate decarboxylase [Candidatus Woesebacteria bacterium]|nr:diphosphomevalonate decarboxylase [Candidatus Woesebacteria bacterium]